MALSCNEYELGLRAPGCAVPNAEVGRSRPGFPPPGSGAGKQQARMLAERKGGQTAAVKVGGQGSTAMTEQRDS